MLVIIILNVIYFAFLESPSLPKEGTVLALQLTFQSIFMVLFWLEMLIKIFAVGFVAYIKNGWNILDCLLNIYGFVQILKTPHFVTKSHSRSALKYYFVDPFCVQLQHLANFPCLECHASVPQRTGPKGAARRAGLLRAPSCRRCAGDVVLVLCVWTHWNANMDGKL